MSALLVNNMVGASESVRELDSDPDKSSIGVLSMTSLGETTSASLADSDTVGDSRSLVMGKTVGDSSSLTSLASLVHQKTCLHCWSTIWWVHLNQ